MEKQTKKTPNKTPKQTKTPTKQKITKPQTNQPPKFKILKWNPQIAFWRTQLSCNSCREKQHLLKLVKQLKPGSAEQDNRTSLPVYMGSDWIQTTKSFNVIFPLIP